VLLATQLALMFVPWAMAVAVHFTDDLQREWCLYALSGVNAVTLTFARPARVALLPNLVPRSAYHNAFTWNSSLYETSSWMGPAIAGFLLWLGAEWAFWFSGLLMLACLGLTLLLPNPPATNAQRTPSWTSLVAGLKFVFRTEMLLSVMTMDLLAVLLGGVVYLLPVFAIDRLHVGPLGFGALRAATAFGAALMALYQAHHPVTRAVGAKLLWAVAGYGAATVVFGLSTSFVLSLMMLFLMGIFDNVSVVVRQTLVQCLTPDALRGRVSSVEKVFVGASNDLGGAESGWTAKMFGPVASVVGGGLGTMAVVGWVAWKWPQTRRLQTLHGLEPIVYDDPDPLAPSPIAPGSAE
jgi:MFS family permease